MAADQADQWVASLRERMTVWENESAFVQRVRLSWMEQYQMGVVQPCGGNGRHLKPGATPFDHEFRRSWVGATADLHSGTHLSVTARIGGLPARDQAAGQGMRKDYTYADLYEVWVQQDVATLPGASVKVGKVSPLLTTDYIASAAELTCVERSLIGGPQYGLDSDWGVELSYRPTDRAWVFAQLLANDRACEDKDNEHPDAYRDGRGAKGEFGWEDKCFAIVGGEYRLPGRGDSLHILSAQYAHDFDNTYGSASPAGANSYGLNAHDVLSLGYEWQQPRVTLITNIIANAEMRHAGAKGNNNNIGWQVQPVIHLLPRADLVLRYTGMTGRDACRLGADRYVTRRTTAPAWADSIHAFYIGTNLYLSAEDKHAAKIMLGAEYLQARRDGGTAYAGWEFLSALRWRF